MTKLTFKPLSRGRYRCNQTGTIMTQRQILAYVSGFLATGHEVKIAPTHSPSPNAPAEEKKQDHPSKYRTKHS